MVIDTLAAPIRGTRKSTGGTDCPEILDAPEAVIFRTVERDEDDFETWYRREVMPVLYERQEPTYMEFDCC